LATKDQPGPFDDYAALQNDEPYYLLMARDVDAPEFVRAHAARRRDAGDTSPRVEEAFKAADAMEAWQDSKRATGSTDYVLTAFHQLHRMTHATGTFETCLEPICALRRRVLAALVRP
jgi:hypothetical protein